VPVQEPDSVTLTNCDREPIHIPGSIQPQGCLLACDVAFTVIRRHSKNAGEFLGTGLADINGATVEDVLGGDAAHSIRNALMHWPHATRPALLTSLRVGKSHFDVAAHRHKGETIIEIEHSEKTESARPLHLSRTLIARLKELGASNAMMEQTPRLVRSLLDYDRVMIYRFGHDGAGQVIAEAKRADLESFLGQYFPASDIPRQARELYLRNTIRLISDVNAPRIPIEPALDVSGEPLDLSFAHLRSVSPVHCEYLRNMGVAASMSISIIVGGRLWGLLACHHYSPRKLSMAERIAAEMFGDYFSLNLEAMHQRERLEAALRARRTLDDILLEVSYRDDIATFLSDRVDTFGAILPCDGVGIWLNGTWNGHGSVPPKSAIPGLARFVATVSEGRVWTTHQLSVQLPAAADYAAHVSGVLAVPLSQMPRDYLFFFRKEVIETIQWAGDPNKSYESGPLGDRLTPRTSFAIWKETVERQSIPWSTADRDSAEAARTALLEVLMRQNEILAAERRQADVRQKVLNDELNHRVKNILALIKSLISQSTSQDRSLEDYVGSLKGRIMALSFAHDQVVRSDGGGDLRDLLDAELGPYKGGSRTVLLDGPGLSLDARAYSVMALVLHEMATNAAKYGALSVDDGKLDVRWSVDTDRDCELVWNESGGPPVVAPQHRGFGTVLVDRSIPYDLGGQSEIDFAPGGVQARFRIPGAFVSLRESAKRAARTRVAPSDGKPALDGQTVLLVEDQLIIALEVEGALSSNGAKVLTAATSAEALRLLSREKPDVAILDVNLGVGSSIPVAYELIRRGIPFVFATGYGDSTQIPAELKKQIVVRKPYDAPTLLEALAKLKD
jgi:light-regulated signal transduction histidine kinase (bacteriophytochrome)/CheY-like chemotaxis protein